MATAIKRYVSQGQLAAPAAPSTNVSNALGSALEGFGSAVGNLGETIANRNKQREEFKTNSQYQRMKLQLADELNKSIEQAPADGAGLHDSFMKQVYEPKRQEFLASIPPNLRQKYELILSDDDGTGNPGVDTEGWSIKAATAERDRMYSWADQEVQTTQEQLATAISLDPDAYDQLLQAGMDELDSAPMPTALKEQRRKEWEDLARTAILNRLLETAPEKIIKDLDGDPRYLSPTTQYTILEQALIGQESSGDPTAVSPKGALGLMQVMPGTAREIAKEIGDADFPQTNDPAIVGEYVMRPSVNKRYGSYYLRKQIKAFGGDLEAALIAYNGGPERAKAWLAADRDDGAIPAETRKYYKAIMAKLPGAGSKETVTPAQFVWVRDGGSDLMQPGDKRMAGVNPDLQARVAIAFGAAGVDKVRVRSAFRSKAANKAAKGAKNSQHLDGNALDLDVSGMPVAKRIELINALSANGITGIGVYANTIHADMGSRRAWGPTYHDDSIPNWAKTAVAAHLSNTARAPSVAGRYSTMPYSKRQEFITKADQAITAQYNANSKVSAVQKVELSQRMDAELASIANSGQTTGFDDTQVAELLGEDDYMKWIANKQQSQRLFGAKQGITFMTPDEMGARLQDYEAVPGSPSYDKDRAVENAVQKEIDRVTKLRTSRPDAAALEYPEVKDAYKEVLNGLAANQPDTENIQRLVKIMLDTQAEFNIAPDTRAPIPREWALDIGKSLTRTPDMSAPREEVNASIVAQYMRLKEYFGDYTDEVLLYSLKEYKGLPDNTADYIANAMSAVGAGRTPSWLPDPNRAVDMDHVESASDRNWFQRTWDNIAGNDENVVPGVAAEDTSADPERVLRALRWIENTDGPVDEAYMIRRFGPAATSAAMRQSEKR